MILMLLLQHTKVVNCDSIQKGFQLQKCLHNLSIAMYIMAIAHTKVVNCDITHNTISIPKVHTKVVNYNIAHIA